MCEQPLVVNSAEVGCRKCKQCRSNYVTDWVGRCIAEGEVSVAVSSVTLTYREAGPHTAILTYSDVQRFLRSLRRDGFPVRYVVAGEYGTKKGRAHWHAILFWKARAPWHEVRKNFHQENWPHGFSFWDESNVAALKYVCKYILKPTDDDYAQSEFYMSRFPPIGAEYFRRLARRYVEAGLAPQDASYSFPDVRQENGELVRFWLHRHSLDRFIKSFLVQWELYRGGHPPVSELVEDWCDKNPHWRVGHGET